MHDCIHGYIQHWTLWLLWFNIYIMLCVLPDSNRLDAGARAFWEVGAVPKREWITYFERPGPKRSWICDCLVQNQLKRTEDLPGTRKVSPCCCWTSLGRVAAASTQIRMWATSFGSRRTFGLWRALSATCPVWWFVRLGRARAKSWRLRKDVWEMVSDLIDLVLNVFWTWNEEFARVCMMCACRDSVFSFQQVRVSCCHLHFAILCVLHIICMLAFCTLGVIDDLCGTWSQVCAQKI